MEENLRTAYAELRPGTTEFLSRQVDDAKRALDEQDSKLADFKRKYMGQLPGDADNNLRLLMSMNSQLGCHVADSESRATGQGLYRKPAGAATSGLEEFAVQQQSADLGTAVEPSAGAADAIAGALYGRSS